MNRFAEKLRFLRVKNQKTLREVAKYLDKSTSYLSDLEHGRRNPPEKETVRQIEEFLGVNDGILAKLSEEYKSMPYEIKMRIKHNPQFADMAQMLLRAEEDLSNEQFAEIISEVKKRIPTDSES